MSGNAIVHDAFTHSAWATKTLLEACRALSAEQLTREAPGYGSIVATFNHVVRSDAAYAHQLGAPRPGWADDGSAADVDELERRADEVAGSWDDVMVGELDPERVVVLEEGRYDVHAGVIVAQALHHANVHREQICAALTALRIQPPDLQPWAYADATGRGRWHD